MFNVWDHDKLLGDGIMWCVDDIKENLNIIQMGRVERIKKALNIYSMQPEG